MIRSPVPVSPAMWIWYSQVSDMRTVFVECASSACARKRSFRTSEPEPFKAAV